MKEEHTMLTGQKDDCTETPEGRLSETDPHSDGKAIKRDLECAVSMLRIKLQSAQSLSEKVRIYSQIKALQDNIAALNTEDQARP
jgi:hypothetical protein